MDSVGGKTSLLFAGGVERQGPGGLIQGASGGGAPHACPEPVTGASPRLPAESVPCSHSRWLCECVHLHTYPPGFRVVQSEFPRLSSWGPPGAGGQRGPGWPWPRLASCSLAALAPTAASGKVPQHLLPEPWRVTDGPTHGAKSKVHDALLDPPPPHRTPHPGGKPSAAAFSSLLRRDLRGWPRPLPWESARVCPLLCAGACPLCKPVCPPLLGTEAPGQGRLLLSTAHTWQELRIPTE